MLPSNRQLCLHTLSVSHLKDFPAHSKNQLPRGELTTHNAKRNVRPQLVSMELSTSMRVRCGRLNFWRRRGKEDTCPCSKLRKPFSHHIAADQNEG